MHHPSSRCPAGGRGCSACLRAFRFEAPCLTNRRLGSRVPLPAPAGACLGAPFGGKATNFTAENKSPGFVLAPAFTQLVNALAGCLRRRVLRPAGLEACLPRDLQLAPARTRRRASEVSGLERACGDWVGFINFTELLLDHCLRREGN